MAKRSAKWRVVYLRHLKDKVRGTGSYDEFKFFDDDEKGLLGVEYCAFLECMADTDDKWLMLGRIIKPGPTAGIYILQDIYGENFSPGTLTSRIFTILLRQQNPSVHDFLCAISSPKADLY
jgi:hypothetical protein